MIHLKIVQVFPSDPAQNESNLNRIWIAQQDGEPVGQIKLDFVDAGESRIAFVTNLVVSSDLPEVTAMLIQKARKYAKGRGYDRTFFTVQPPYTDLLRLIDKGHAQEELRWLSVKN